MKKNTGILLISMIYMAPVFAIADIKTTSINQYVAELPSQSSAILGSTSLNHTYLPLVFSSFELNSSASRTISESDSYPQNNNSGGGGSGFSFTMNNQSSQSLYVYIQGSVNQTWGAAACLTNSASTQEYIDSCVGTGGISTPGNPDFTVYFSKSLFNSQATYETATHFLSCPSSVGSNYDLTAFTFTLSSSLAYELTIDSSGNCSLGLLS